MMNKILATFFLLVGLLLSGCENANTEKKLIGNWESSIFLSSAEAAKMSEEPLPEGMSIEITMAGSQTYHIGGKYNGDAEITLRLQLSDRELPLRFYLRDAGTWELHDDTLVETSSDSVVTPMDDFTKNIVAQSPELQNMVAPMSGESTSLKLIHISDTSAEMEMLDPPYLRFTLKKNVNIDQH